MTVRLTGAVMAHPRRTASAETLISSAPFLDLVLDPDPSGPPTGLRTSMRAWSSVPAGSTHHLVLEDDAQLCEGFRDQAERAVAAAPDAAIVLFTAWGSRNGAVVRLGALSGARWATPVAEYTANVALILPAAVGEGFADYARAHGGTWPDDVILARYLKSLGVPTYLTVPNLVEHGEFPSISGNDRHGLRLSACHSAVPADTDWSLDNLIEPDAVPFFKFGVAQCTVRSADRWLTVGTDRGSRKLGVDVDRCETEFDRAKPAIPLPPGRLAAFWRTAYTLGLLTTRYAATAISPDDPLVDKALSTLGPGGLCMEVSAAELRALQAPLRDLAWTAVSAGACQPEFPRTGRRILFTGPDCALRRTLVADLADRGHTVRTTADPASDQMAADDTVVELVTAGPPTRISVRCHVTGSPAVLRLGVPYGPEIVDYSPINDLVLQSLTIQPMRAETSLPDAVRFVHVWDIGAALARIVESPWLSGEFDLCHDEVVSPVELAEVIARSVRSVAIDLVRVPGELSGPALCPERAKAELGWRPAVDLAEGVRTVAQWLAYEAD
ncbi:NAD-dependent epimerase/dehydratase family protein [Actinocrispum wychmicini]|uniref:Nucleoside-diphosphate-sugar epimerase n=1 Tax=Actinocrispum wychmicini TaxID=1213861 RepID=A0A4R2ILH8_9PSEU|nr:NAD(P)-dependent oxidoreductase [Actinocrispum wychmicini]TCO44789.1 hypothetical protein EV192_12246 [Actinocrispum wychmicini]